MRIIFESSTNQQLILPDAPVDSTIADLADSLNGLLRGKVAPIDPSQLQATGVNASALEEAKDCDALGCLVDQVASLEIFIKSSVPFAPPAEPLRGGSSILFAGQGTDVGRTVADLLAGASPEAETAIRKTFSRASTVLGYDLLDVCLNHTAKLKTTLYSQPAIVVASLAGLERAKADKWAPLEGVKHVAGFSLGEYSALIYSGAVSFEDGIRLVQARAQAMDEETQHTKGSMVTVMGLNDEQLNELCAAAQTACGTVSTGPTDCHTMIQIANYLFPKARVLSGDAKVIDWVVANASKHGALMAKKLPVAGAFHSPYMQGARTKLKAALETTAISLPTKVNVFSNVTAKPYNSAKEIKQLLEEQLVASVRWEQSIINMRSKLQVAKFIDAGPGMQLKSMMRRIDPKMFNDTALIGK